MITINDKIEKWEISLLEFKKIKEGNHRIFQCTEKSFTCEHCGIINTFRIGSTALFCIHCLKDLPKADLLLTRLAHRIMYHFEERASIYD